jgi:hypothetical protein
VGASSPENIIGPWVLIYMKDWHIYVQTTISTKYIQTVVLRPLLDQPLNGSMRRLVPVQVDYVLVPPCRNRAGQGAASAMKVNPIEIMMNINTTTQQADCTHHVSIITIPLYATTVYS